MTASSTGTLDRLYHDPPALTDPATTRWASEDDWLHAAGEALSYNGWWWIHARPSRTTDGGWVTATQGSGASGFPDITAVRGRRLLFIELKSTRGKVTAAQQDWLARLRDAGVEAVLVRLPVDWDSFNVLIQRDAEQLQIPAALVGDNER